MAGLPPSLGLGREQTERERENTRMRGLQYLHARGLQYLLILGAHARGLQYLFCLCVCFPYSGPAQAGRRKRAGWSGFGRTNILPKRGRVQHVAVRIRDG